MRAWIKQKGQYGLIKVEKEVPQVKDDEVLVKVLSTGICGTDIGIYKGYRAVPENLVPGHEFCGIVVDKGKNVKLFDIGDMVVPSIIVRCGRCPACLNGYEAQCENLSEIGIHFDGSFADYVAVPEIAVHKVARDLDPDIGASIEPVAVSYSAVKKVSGIIAGSKVIVYGPGPIGLYMTQILALAGASKIVVIGASSENRLALARSYGALTIKTSTENMDEKLKEYLPPNGKADYIFEASGAADALGQLTKYIAPHGEIILAGVYKEAGAVDLIDIVRTECRIKGTFCYTLSEFEKAIDLVSEGKINFEGIVSKFSLDELTEGFESTIHKKSIKVILEVNAP